MEDQTGEHEVVTELHGGLFRCRGCDAAACTLKGEGYYVAVYEEAGVPDGFDTGDSFTIDDDSGSLLVTDLCGGLAGMGLTFLRDRDRFRRSRKQVQ